MWKTRIRVVEDVALRVKKQQCLYYICMKNGSKLANFEMENLLLEILQGFVCSGQLADC